MFAVIKTGGKQYIVQEGEVLTVEKLDIEPGQPVEFETLLISDEEGKDMQLGTPTVKGSVKGEVVGHGRAAKISVVKYKAKSKYHRRVGHRQHFSKVKINSIG